MLRIFPETNHTPAFFAEIVQFGHLSRMLIANFDSIHEHKPELKLFHEASHRTSSPLPFTSTRATS